MVAAGAVPIRTSARLDPTIPTSQRSATFSAPERSMMQVRNGKMRRIRFIDSLTLLADA
jgi:hypothetical protein